MRKTSTKRFSKRKGIPVGDAMMRFFRSIGAGERFQQNLAIAFWDISVGKEIARHTEPIKVIDGVMMVRVDDNVWRNELLYFKHEIIQKLNRKIGKTAIKEIKFY